MAGQNESGRALAHLEPLPRNTAHQVPGQGRLEFGSWRRGIVTADRGRTMRQCEREAKCLRDVRGLKGPETTAEDAAVPARRRWETSALADNRRGGGRVYSPG